MSKKSIRTAVVGCGMISEVYLQNMMHLFHNLDVIACCDADPARAQVRAEEHGIESRTLEEILDDPSIEMVVILTPVPTHYDLIRQALEAGKHVYTEKTMAILTKEASELCALADKKGLYLGAAPDTFLGAALQKARALIDEGVLGEITSFNVCANRDLNYFTCHYRFLRLPGGGICYDYGVYYLTALVSLLGPMAAVSAMADNPHPVRIDCNPDSPDFGSPFAYKNESRVTALLQTESGIPGTFTLNGESIHEDLAVFTLYGTKAVLKLNNPNFFGGSLVLTWYEGEDQKTATVENDLPYGQNSRGIGPSEMADAILSGGQNRASKELACHVLDIINTMLESSQKQCFLPIQTTCTQPPALQYDTLY